jgi:hypothetical protein
MAKSKLIRMDNVAIVVESLDEASTSSLPITAYAVI